MNAVTLPCVCGGSSKISRHTAAHPTDSRIILDEWHSTACLSCGLRLGERWGLDQWGRNRYLSAQEAADAWNSIMSHNAKPSAT